MERAWKCLTCGLVFSSKNKLDKHRKDSGEAKPRKQKRVCQKCGKTFTNIRFHNSECPAIQHGVHHWTEEEKKNISDRMKLFYKEHPEKHVWKRAEKLKSKPCEEFKKFLKEKGYDFLEEVSVVKDRNYSVDICFPNLMLILEINGNQHYDLLKGCLKPYYQERHDVIVNLGWEVVEIPYNQSYNAEFRERVCRQLDAKLTSNQYIWEFESPHPYIKTLQDKQLEKNKRKEKLLLAEKEGKTSNGRIVANKLSFDEIKYREEQILSCGVDLTKFGWVSKITEKTGLTKRQIEVVYNYSEKLKQTCFRRK